MLLTDGNPNSSDDLRVYESSILDVAYTERIDLGAKLDLAREEISQDVIDLLLDLFSADPRGAVRRNIGVSDVAVTRQMLRWHAVHTLEIVYRDAFNNQLNDRYKAKFDEYRELSQNAREHTMRFGIGLVSRPIPQADVPVVSSVSGSLAAATYYVRVAWVSADGEGNPSDATTFDAPPNSVPVVKAQNSPTGVTGFNVYMGLAADSLTLQTGSPVAVGSNFTFPGSGLIIGRVPESGQDADVYITGARMLRRG